MKTRTIGILALTTMAGQGLAAAPALRWEALPPLPDKHGFAGMYAGVSGGALIAAGGANFSERPHAQGGTKIWHDRIFALAKPDGEWREVGRLARPSAYGVSGTWRDAVVCAGGGDAATNFAESWLMRWNGRAITTEPLPPLPVTLAQGNGMVIGDVVYVMGGREKTDSATPLARFLTLDLSREPAGRKWEEQAWPAGATPRFNGVVGAHDGEFFYFSGIALTTDAAGALEYHYLSDAYAFKLGRGWRRLADMPYATAAAPGPAIPLPPSGLLVLSGVNAPWGSPTGPGGATPGFSKKVLAYSVKQDQWSAFPDSPDDPSSPPTRVTVPMVEWQGRFAAINGEIAPGLRSPTVLSLVLIP